MSIRSKRSKFGAFAILAIFALLIVARIAAMPYRKLGGRDAINNEDTNQTKQEAVQKGSSNESAGDVSINDSEDIYKSKSGIWSAKFPSAFISSEETKDKVVYKSKNDTLTVAAGSSITNNFPEYVKISTEPVKIGDETGTKILEDSRDHTDGLPANRILIVDFTHGGTDYQVAYFYEFKSQDNAKNKTTEFDQFLKDFKFLK